MQAGLSTRNAPSPSVVLPHYAYSAIAFVVATAMLFFVAGDLTSSIVMPHVLSVAHLLILGWITMVIFGALYQLIPVVMEVKLHSEKLAMASFILLGTGTPLMAWSFFESYISPTILMSAGGSMIVLSVILFVINAVKSAGKSEIKSMENRFIIASVYWLALTVFAGLGIIFFPEILQYNFFKIHIHLGIVGWFMMLVVGVASTLMPMFFISHQLNKKYLERAFWAVNGGLVLLIAAFAINIVYLQIAAAVIIIAGFALFFKYNYDAYKKRLRRNLDIGMKHSVLAFVLFILSLAAAFISAFGEMSGMEIMNKANTIYGISLFFGFLTSLILGQMYKTLPFIVWLKLYQDKVGKFKTPLPADMHSQKAADAHYYTYIAGFVLLVTGVIAGMELIIQIAAVLLFITALLYAYNVFVVLLHKEKLEPLSFGKPAVKK